MPFFILFYTKSMQKVYFCSQNFGICCLVAIVERRASSILCSQYLNLITYWGDLLWGDLQELVQPMMRRRMKS
jgi:hypothetical protein